MNSVLSSQPCTGSSAVEQMSAKGMVMSSSLTRSVGSPMGLATRYDTSSTQNSSFQFVFDNLTVTLGIFRGVCLQIRLNLITLYIPFTFLLLYLQNQIHVFFCSFPYYLYLIHKRNLFDRYLWEMSLIWRRSFLCFLMVASLIKNLNWKWIIAENTRKV